MSLTEQLTDYVHAAFSGLWVLTQEPDEAEREIAQLARGRGWKLACWDVAQGLRCPDAPHAAEAGAGDPLAVLRAVPALADRDGTALVLLHAYGRLGRLVAALKEQRKQSRAVQAAVAPLRQLQQLTP